VTDGAEWSKLIVIRKELCIDALIVHPHMQGRSARVDDHVQIGNAFVTHRILDRVNKLTNPLLRKEQLR